MLLEGKTAVIYGGGGAVGGAVAQAFAREGATVVIAGRSRDKLDRVAAVIRASGGKVETAIVDALDRDAVERFLDDVVARTGKLDISFTAVGLEDIQGTPLVEMTADDFMQPLTTGPRALFLTGTAAARRMQSRRAGVIMTITARPDLVGHGNCGGFGVTCAALESICRNFAIEFGRDGIRTVCIRSAGSPDSPGVEEVFALHGQNAGTSREAFEAELASGTLLGRLPRLAEVANAAALMASDHASAMTAVIANVTSGECVD